LMHIVQPCDESGVQGRAPSGVFADGVAPNSTNRSEPESVRLPGLLGPRNSDDANSRPAMKNFERITLDPAADGWCTVAATLADSHDDSPATPGRRAIGT